MLREGDGGDDDGGDDDDGDHDDGDDDGRDDDDGTVCVGLDTSSPSVHSPDSSYIPDTGDSDPSTDGGPRAPRRRGLAW